MSHAILPGDYVDTHIAFTRDESVLRVVLSVRDYAFGKMLTLISVTSDSIDIFEMDIALCRKINILLDIYNRRHEEKQVHKSKASNRSKNFKTYLAVRWYSTYC